MKIRRFSLLLGIVVFLSHQTVTLECFAWKQTHSQNDTSVLLQQPKSCFYYTVNNSGSDDVSFDELESVVRTSFATWQDVTCSYFSFIGTDAASLDEVAFHTDRGNANLLVWRESPGEWPFTKAAVAMTTVQHDPKTGVIYDADIEFNGAWYVFGARQSYPPNTAITDLENTITHEIGHTVGLDHTDDPSATMYADARPGETLKRTLADDDIEGLCALYPLEDDPEECLEPYCGFGFGEEDTECTGVYLEDDGGCSCDLIGKSEPGRSLFFGRLWRIAFGEEA